MTDDRDPSPAIWLITGSSSGFGRALAERVLAGGDVVVATSRRADRLADLVAVAPDRVFPLEVELGEAAHFDAATRIVDDVVATHGRLDVLVNNAGRTQVGALEETTEDELRALFELHFFGPAALTRAALPHFRRQGGGVVVQISSVGGQVTAPGFGAYCATKFALEGLTETLRDEVPGVRFVIVEPGAFRTGLFGAGSAVMSAELPEYADTVGPTRAYVSGGDGDQPGDPDQAAAAIHRVVVGHDAPLRLVLGPDAVASVRTRLEALTTELDAWESLSGSTDFTDAP